MDGSKLKLKCILGLLIIIAIFTISTINVDAAYVNSDVGLNLRSRPDTKSTITTVIPFGEYVKELVTKEDWSKIDYDGVVGYVFNKYIQDEEPIKKRYLGNFFITAYEDTGLLCANGAYPTVGYTVAHNSLPFGTVLYIEGVGYRTVEDRGPSYLGDEWLDLYLGDSSECYAWGEQHRDVYIVEKENEY